MQEPSKECKMFDKNDTYVIIGIDQFFIFPTSRFAKSVVI